MRTILAVLFLIFLPPVVAKLYCLCLGPLANTIVLFFLRGQIGLYQ